MEINIQYYGHSESVYNKFKYSRLFNVSERQEVNRPIKVKKYTDVVMLHVSGNTAQQIFQIQYAKSQLLNFNKLLIVIGEQSKLLKYLQYGASEAFDYRSPIEQIEKRVAFIIEHPITNEIIKTNHDLKFRLPLWKRLFDIAFAGTALLFLTPLFIVIAILIRLESKGPVFYAAKRVGSGYKVFDFYKFRSMYKDADKRVKELMKQSQYANEKVEEQLEAYAGVNNSTMLMYDDGTMTETELLTKKQVEEERAFFKLANDPRITKVGKFIRNTSIDELPQFLNVLKGDMSIVGNRPLPLYEAEKLTTDNWAQRYLAPAGLTGLWQVNQRAKSNNMSASERKMLDVTYAQNYNFFSDMVIILKTLPAMLQHENV